MFENLALSDNGFLFDAQTGNTFSLNRTGTFVLRQLIDGAALDGIAAMVIDAFDVDAETANRDVEQFLFRLKELGLTPAEEGQS